MTSYNTNINLMSIQIYRVSEKENSTSFIHNEVCRECAKNFQKRGLCLEIDGHLQKYVYEKDGVTYYSEGGEDNDLDNEIECSICGNYFLTDHEVLQDGLLDYKFINMKITELKKETFQKMSNNGEIANNSDNEDWVNKLIQTGFDLCKKEYEEKLRWIPVEEKLPPVGIELQCKIEKLSWTDNKYAIGVFSENKVWSIDGRHVSHYKDAVNNCVTHYRFFFD